MTTLTSLCVLPGSGFLNVSSRIPKPRNLEGPPIMDEPVSVSLNAKGA